MLEIQVKEVQLSGIKSPEQLGAFVLESLGLSDLKDESDVRILMEFIRRKEGLKVDEIRKAASLGQTATYSRIRKFVNSGLVYKSKGSMYRLRERTLKETLDFRVRKEIMRVFDSIVEVGEELEAKIK
jgi:predicted transcriptional regulator